MFSRRALDVLRRSVAPHGRLPSWLDGVLAIAILAVALAHTHHSSPLTVLLNVALVVPLLWRRRAPVTVFILIWVVAGVQGLASSPTFADSALLVSFYTVASASEVRTTMLAGTALELGIVLTVTRLASGTDPWLREFIALSGLATAAGVLGINVRHRRQIVSGLRERAERLEHEREHELALATITERSRIARELHDVVAHNLSVMLALCDGAAYHVHDDPERVEDALEQASRTGRQALAEMRHLLGILRDEPAGSELSPQPGVRQIDELIDQVRAAGVPVTYSVSGHLDGAASGIELALYRIVQESLTNTLKHAGPDASVAVSLTCVGESVEVEVRDTGMGTADTRAGGAGLRGMRERAALYDGTLQAGPCARGGWEVRARFGVPTATLTR